MRKLMLVLMITMVCLSRYAYAENFDFRSTRWGMTKEEVIKSENISQNQQLADNIITYDEELFGRKVKLSYFFTSEKLFQAIYVLEKNDRLFFQHAISVISNKYGNYKEKSRDAVIWNRGDTTINVGILNDAELVIIKYNSEMLTKEENKRIIEQYNKVDRHKL